MRWNEYAKVGEEFVKAFRRTAFDRVTLCDFIFEVLDRLKLDEGYHAVAMRGDNLYILYAVRDEDMRRFRRMKCEDAYDSFEFEFNDHLKVERSAMGVWQAKLIDEVVCQMPLAGTSRYMKRRYIFSTADLRSVKNRGGFDSNVFVGDERLVPSVEMRGDSAVVRHCYWNDWQGLVLWTDHLAFDEEMKMSLRGTSDKVLFKYDCGLSYSDVDFSTLWVRRRPVEDGMVAVDVVIAPVSGGQHFKEFGRSSDEDLLKELEREAQDWIDDYDDSLMERETDRLMAEEQAREEEKRRRKKEEEDRMWAGSLFGDEEMD